VTRESLDQGRARRALERHGRYPPAKSPFWSHYATAANGLPTAVRTSGLILALATEIAAASGRLEPGRTAVLADLVDWLGEWSRRHAPGWLGRAELSLPEVPEGGEAPLEAIAEWRDLVVAAAETCCVTIIRAERRRYMVIEAETLAYLAWLKTLAAPRRPKEDRA
jgi:hypothetical protein